MLIFNKPVKLNGTRLINELKAVGLEVDSVVDNGSGSIYLELPDSDKSKAQKVVNDHKGEDIIDLKIAIKESAISKLAALGLTEEEAQLILGGSN